MVAFGAISLLALFTPEAEAQFRPAGAISGQALVTSGARLDGTGWDAGYGGGIIGDITAPFGIVRVGGSIGVFAITSQVDDASRVFMPVALSVSLVLRHDRFWADVRGRAGLWAGVSNQGLVAGPYFTAGAFFGYELSETVAIGAVVDAVFVLANGDTIGVAPGIGVVWSPAVDEP
jgi:hypothetical protein